jgi:hypothetical protein
MRRNKISSLEASMDLPRGVRIRRWFGHWAFRKKDFRRVVAQETYCLTHEFILNKLWDEFTHGTYTSAPRRGVLLELEKDMARFTHSVADGEDGE